MFTLTISMVFLMIHRIQSFSHYPFPPKNKIPNNTNINNKIKTKLPYFIQRNINKNQDNDVPWNSGEVPWFPILPEYKEVDVIIDDIPSFYTMIQLSEKRIIWDAGEVPWTCEEE